MAEEQKYRIIRKLDAGGMAEVFVAEAESLKGFKRRVAIKRILPHLTKNRKFVQMFLDEAKLSLQLQHANIVSVFDIGKADNTFFIVMDFIDGATLKHVIDSTKRRGRLIPMAQAIYIIREVCEGLSYAHDQNDLETGQPLGIVHRDVSPPNILISNRGEIKLVDFGLAKATSQLESTDPGVVKGKFSYLSPEAASGVRMDSRADIFSAGIILWELLTGRRLFYGENDYQTVELVRQGSIPPMAVANPNVPRELEEVILKALTRNPAGRYQNASEFGESLTRFLFSRGLAVSRNDIARLCQETVNDQEAAAPRVVEKAGGIIDALIQEEILKFTSLDDLEDPLDAGSKPLSPEDISVMTPLDPGDFIDPRGWASDLEEEPPLEMITDRPPERRPEVERAAPAASRKAPAPAASTSEEDQARMPVPTHRKPSPPPREEKKSSMPAAVWVLALLALIAVAGVALVLTGIIEI
jgi:serine/threonine-protein kinase